MYKYFLQSLYLLQIFLSFLVNLQTNRSKYNFVIEELQASVIQDCLPNAVCHDWFSPNLRNEMDKAQR